MKSQASILVVDDNKDLLNTFSLILKRKGYLVETAEDGLQAIEKFTERHFDVVLMDVIMPQLNGIDALHKMREYDPKAKVILMTAYCDENQLQDVRREGACGTLYKPVNISKLMEMIGEVTQDPSILIVDDDDDFRFTMAHMLELSNYRVITAVNGEDALRIARERLIHIAFVDVKMQMMNGLETSIKLKEIRPDMLIVMMTGYREEVGELVDSARDKGVITCLYKPFKLNEVRDLVSQSI
jgi:DNA-binding NtrC family response regulator